MANHQVGDGLNKCDGTSDDCLPASNCDPVRVPDSAHESSHRDDGMQKSFDREERLRLAKERQAEEKQRKLRDLRESAEKAQEFRRKQEEERRKKVEEMRRREDEHRAIVEERRKKLLQEQKEKVRAVMKKNDERKVKVVERKPKKRVDAISAAVESCSVSPGLSTSPSKQFASDSVSPAHSHEICGAHSFFSSEQESLIGVSFEEPARSGFCLEGRAKACRSEDTLSGSASPWKSVPQRRRPHSIAGRCPSYAGHTVASQLRRSRGDDIFTSAVFCCSRFRSVSPTPTEMKGRARSTDSCRKSRIDHQQLGLASGRQSMAMSLVSAARGNMQPPPLHSNLQSSTMHAVPTKVKSTPLRPSQLVGVSPAGGHLVRTPCRPLRTPSPKTMAASVTKSSDKPTYRRLPSPQKASAPPYSKANDSKVHVDVATSKPPLSSSSKLLPCENPTVPDEKIVNLTDGATIDKSESAKTGGVAVDKSEPAKQVVEEEYKLKLAEKRRQAREVAERKVAEECRLEKEQRQAEEDERLREEEEQRLREEEELRHIEESQQAERVRLQRAMEEEIERRRREDEKLETERKERLASEQKVREENERREQERLEKSRRDEEDRAERKKKLELIMKRVKVDDNSSKVESSPVSSTGGTVLFDYQEKPQASVECVTSPLDCLSEAQSSFRSPLLQQMMVTRAKCQSLGETSKEPSIEKADSTGNHHEQPTITELNDAKKSSFDAKYSRIEIKPPREDISTHIGSTVAHTLETSSDCLLDSPDLSNICPKSVICHPSVQHLQSDNSDSVIPAVSSWSSELGGFVSDIPDTVVSDEIDSRAAVVDTISLHLESVSSADNMLNCGTELQVSKGNDISQISSNLDDNTDSYLVMLPNDEHMQGGDTDCNNDPAGVSPLLNEVNSLEDCAETIIVSGEGIDMFGLPYSQSMDGFGNLSLDMDKNIPCKLPPLVAVMQSQIRSDAWSNYHTEETMPDKLKTVDDDLSKAIQEYPLCTSDLSSADVQNQSLSLQDFREKVDPVKLIKKPELNYSTEAYETHADTSSFSSIDSVPVNLSNNPSCLSQFRGVEDLCDQTYSSMTVEPVSLAGNSELCHIDVQADVTLGMQSLVNQEYNRVHSLMENAEDRPWILAAPVQVAGGSNVHCREPSIIVSDDCLMDVCMSDLEAFKDEAEFVDNSDMNSSHADSIPSKFVDDYFSNLIQPVSSSPVYADNIDLDNVASVDSTENGNRSNSKDNRSTNIRTKSEMARESLPRYLELNAADLIEDVYKSRTQDTDSILTSSSDKLNSNLWTNTSVVEDLPAVSADVLSFWLANDSEKPSSVEIPSVEPESLSVGWSDNNTVDLDEPDVAMARDEDKDVSAVDLLDFLMRGSGPDAADPISDQITDSVVVEQNGNKTQNDNDVAALCESQTDINNSVASPPYLQSALPASRMDVANDLANTLVDFSGLPSSIPVVAFEDGKRHMPPPLSGEGEGSVLGGQ